MQIKNPGKQRKMLFNAPAHKRHKMMAAPLSTELATQKGAKTLPVRRGDTVRILRGDNKGFEGKVSRVDLKAYRIYMEGLTREKVDGTNIFLAVHPSKVQIRSLNLEDKYRKDTILGRKTTPEKKAPKAAKKKPIKKETEEIEAAPQKAAEETSEEGGQ
jgi:large subunit ribosomal protein L24